MTVDRISTFIKKGKIMKVIVLIILMVSAIFINCNLSTKILISDVPDSLRVALSGWGYDVKINIWEESGNGSQDIYLRIDGHEDRKNDGRTYTFMSYCIYEVIRILKKSNFKPKFLLIGTYFSQSIFKRSIHAIKISRCKMIAGEHDFKFRNIRELSDLEKEREIWAIWRIVSDIIDLPKGERKGVIYIGYSWDWKGEYEIILKNAK